MKQDHFFSSESQIYWGCKALIDGRTISHKSEIREAKGWRLAAIICTLRKRYKWPIQTELRGAENVAHYRLAPNCDISNLRFPRSAKALEGGAK